ncbi:MAG TPA: helix-turn-helix domain-containing protein [Casimicrobiaceae bacterium]|nr:helix-turn-helix domain-containing protein [Casimicrobiaceae bacterium]
MTAAPQAFFEVEPAASWPLDELASQRIRLRRGSALLASGARFSGLYAVRAGSCKAVMTAAGGDEHVAGHYIAGDVIGADAIASGFHDATVVALEDSELALMPLDRIEALARRDPGFQRSVSVLLSREIARDRKAMLMLGTMRAEQRAAGFLLDLSERYGRRGYSPREFVLRLSREDIGSHLGLSQETVSRTLSRLHRSGVLAVRGRSVKLLDREALQRVHTGSTPLSPMSKFASHGIKRKTGRAPTMQAVI